MKRDHNYHGEELRIYTFTIHLYMSAKQVGIQSMHLGVEMGVKYKNTHDHEEKVFDDWATGHKTAIVLGAYNLKGVTDAYNQIKELAPTLMLPFDKFHEDEDSLGGIMTCCGVVVPQSLYDAQPDLDFEDTYSYVHPRTGGKNYYHLGDPAYELIKLLKSKPLA